MSNTPHPWSTYARLQEKLVRRSSIDDHTWGLEAGLNRLLAQEPPAAEDVDRAVRSEGRKERYRTVLRRIHLTVQESAGNQESLFEARQRLRRAAAQVTAEEWVLLRAVGEGYEYKELATTARVAAGTLRARVLRLRRVLVAHAGNGGVEVA